MSNMNVLMKVYMLYMYACPKVSINFVFQGSQQSGVKWNEY